MFPFRSARFVSVAGLLAIAGTAHSPGASGSVRQTSADHALAAEVAAQTAGCYAYTGGEKQRAARDAAIEEVVKEMNILIRPIVRRRLEAANPIVQRLCFSVKEELLTVALDDRSYRAPLGGPPVKVRGITGDEFDLRHVIWEKAIRQIFSGEDGGRVNTFPRSADGHLDMRVRVFSDRLPKDLTYTLSYEKKA